MQTKNKDQLIKDLDQELRETKAKLDEVIRTRKSEGTALLEVDHLKLDN